jgi:hypothetical protein
MLSGVSGAATLLVIRRRAQHFYARRLDLLRSNPIESFPRNGNAPDTGAL